MTETAPPALPDDAAALGAPATTVVGPPADGPRRSGRRWALPAGTLVVGLVAGGIAGAVLASSDPTTSTQYRALQQQLTTARSQVSGAQDRADAAEQAAHQAEASAAAREGQLDQQAAQVSAAAASLTQAQAAINANTISEGTWTVGTDVQPGTYRTTAAVAGECYWEIDRPGGGILKNDIVTGGYPTVSLSAGETFVTRRCGDWLKQ